MYCLTVKELLCEDIEEMSSLIEDDRLLTVERPIRLSGDIISTSTAQVSMSFNF